jgi:hypothetical protein
MKRNWTVLMVVIPLIAACAQTSVQPLSQTMFKVATTAAPACGAKGARDVAYRTAAIEVIKRGQDRFIIMADQSGSELAGMTYSQYGGLQTYNSNLQNMVVQVLATGDPQYANGLSARTTLGADWQAIVAEGAPTTCTA